MLNQEQKRFSDALLRRFRGRDSFPEVLYAAASPGSGKTTVLLETFKRFVEEQPGEVDRMLSRGEKFLVVVFNKKNSEEFTKRLKKAELPLDLFEVSTVNSFFFRNFDTMMKTEGSHRAFRVDYSKSFYTHRMTQEIFSTLVKGSRHPDDKTETLLSRKRILPPELMTKGNIDIAWSLLNAYYSSPYGVSRLGDLEKVAEFFGKKKISHLDFSLDGDTIKRLGNGDEKTAKKTLFHLLVSRSEELATLTVEEVRVTGEKKISFPVEVEIDGQVKTQISEKIVPEKTRIVRHPFKVPHNFYYKSFFRMALTRPKLLMETFSKYRAAGIDEAQDNDQITYLLMEAALQKNMLNTLFLVGDSHQGIYGFKSPSHFDILEHIDNNGETLARRGIKVSRYDLNQTFRFGQKVARFVNAVFGTSITGNPDVADCVYPETLDEDGLVEAMKRKSEDRSVTIVCRSNAEATRLFMLLKNAGVEAKLERSINKELSDFYKKGISAIDDGDVRYGLGKILREEYRCDPNHCTYEQIRSSKRAVGFLKRKGMEELVRYDNEEIEKHVLANGRKRKGAVSIGTAHIFKGAESDFTIVAGDFFRNLQPSREEEYRESPFPDCGAVGDALFGAMIDKPDAGREKTEISKKDGGGFSNEAIASLHLPDNREEANILYVALTRPRMGVAMMESPMNRALLDHCPGDVKEGAKEKWIRSLENSDDATPDYPGTEYDRDLFSQKMSPALQNM